MNELDADKENLIRNAYLEWKAGRGKPWFVIAQSLNIELFDLFKFIRKKVDSKFQRQIEEKEFILQNVDKIPRWKLAEKFDLKPHHFKNLGRATGVSFPKKDIVGLVKWLVEEELHLPINDDLPLHIKTKILNKNRVSNILHHVYAMQKENKELYNLPAMYVAIDLAYPNIYEPWQFRNLKVAYWKDNDLGKIRLAFALRWFVEQKKGIQSETIKRLKNLRGFVTTKELQFYHLHEAFGYQFNSLQEWIDFTYPDDSDHVKRENAAVLKEKLKAKGRVFDKCEICGHEATHIHHIFLIAKGGDNETENLICLCPNHHDQAHKNNFDNLVLQASISKAERVNYFVKLFQS